MVRWHGRRSVELQEGLLIRPMTSSMAAVISAAMLAGCTGADPQVNDSSTSAEAATVERPQGLLQPGEIRTALPDDDLSSQGLIDARDLLKATRRCDNPMRGSLRKLVDARSEMQAEEVVAFQSESGVQSAFSAVVTPTVPHERWSRRVGAGQRLCGLTARGAYGREGEREWRYSFRQQRIRLLIRPGVGGQIRILLLAVSLEAPRSAGSSVVEAWR